MARTCFTPAFRNTDRTQVASLPEEAVCDVTGRTLGETLRNTDGLRIPKRELDLLAGGHLSL